VLEDVPRFADRPTAVVHVDRGRLSGDGVIVGGGAEAVDG
jgi:hypothetical protein